jgi:alkanesulfonate monooxygenase SsuD/methylene tetrahydromethanopterin reductase-like flavin-dependent oxidoreductase (luciferase family)
MKIRVGYGLGVNSLTNDEARYGAFVDSLERLNYDSLWVSERIAGQSADPVVAMAYAAATNQETDSTNDTKRHKEIGGG